MSFSMPRSTTQKTLVALLILSIALCSFAQDDAQDDLMDRFLEQNADLETQATTPRSFLDRIRKLRTHNGTRKGDQFLEQDADRGTRSFLDRIRKHHTHNGTRKGDQFLEQDADRKRPPRTHTPTYPPRPRRSQPPTQRVLRPTVDPMRIEAEADLAESKGTRSFLDRIRKLRTHNGTRNTVNDIEAEVTGGKYYECQVSKTSAVLQSIEQAVKGDAAAVMDSWDTKGDFKEYPHKHADGTLTLRYKCKICKTTPELRVKISSYGGKKGFQVTKVSGNVACDLNGQENLCSIVKLSGNTLSWSSDSDPSANFHWIVRGAAKWLLERSKGGFKNVCKKYQEAEKRRRRRFFG